MIEKSKLLKYLEPCYVGKEIDKKLIYNKIGNEEKEIFKRYVDKIIIKYNIKPKLIGLIPYKLELEDYSEIQIIEIKINNSRAIRDVYSVLISIIPYPIYAIFEYKDKIAFATTSKLKINSRNSSINTKGNINITYLMERIEQDEFLYFISDKNKNSKEFYEDINFLLGRYKQNWRNLDRIMTILDLLFEVYDRKRLEEEILHYCQYRYKCPKKKWESKLDKYKEYSNYKKMVEINELWIYLLFDSPIRNLLNKLKEENNEISSWWDLEQYCKNKIYSFNNDEFYEEYFKESDDDMYEITY